MASFVVKSHLVIQTRPSVNLKLRITESLGTTLTLNLEIDSEVRYSLLSPMKILFPPISFIETQTLLFKGLSLNHSFCFLGGVFPIAISATLSALSTLQSFGIQPSCSLCSNSLGKWAWVLACWANMLGLALKFALTGVSAAETVACGASFVGNCACNS